MFIRIFLMVLLIHSSAFANDARLCSSPKALSEEIADMISDISGTSVDPMKTRLSPRSLGGLDIRQNNYTRINLKKLFEFSCSLSVFERDYLMDYASQATPREYVLESGEVVQRYLFPTAFEIGLKVFELK